MNILKYRWIALVALAVIVAVLFALPRFLQRQEQQSTATTQSINVVSISQEELKDLQQQPLPRAGDPNVSPLPTPEAIEEVDCGDPNIASEEIAKPGCTVTIIYNSEDDGFVNGHACTVNATTGFLTLGEWDTDNPTFRFPTGAQVLVDQVFNINQIEPVAPVFQLNRWPKNPKYAGLGPETIYRVSFTNNGVVQQACIRASLTNRGDP